ncbi:excinuclease ABC subunit UvrC [uncultured Anaerococcus sp.]|uniref:excinuclease ABC subunit UvrC n=1 Tax=uncultured Anaerococcus sp. TaxID=293428 RepID=UPI00288A4EF7|nr:excinuclease ABC subunit UvrC [uncultured Anaerococcus sp.]
MTSKRLREKLKELPDKPGVYIMRNAEGDIIYVGKAISLKRRVRQYFDNNKNKGAKVLAMVSHIQDFEYIIVQNEVEALVLESNLIKKNRPKYNIVLRDDKQYPYIKITREKFPRIQKVRQVKKDGADYFGPYPDAYAVNDAIDLFNLYYPFRTCNLNFDKGQRLDRPCLNYFIKRCKGPCIDKEDETRYLQAMDDVRRFLDHKDRTIPDKVLSLMNEESSKLNFEMAAKYRDWYRALSVISEKQFVTETTGEDIDIIAMSKGISTIIMQVFFMRKGQIVDREHFVIKNEYADSEAEIMSSFLKQFYLDILYIPKEILVGSLPNELESINEYLNQKKGSKVAISQPKLGRKFELINMAARNAHDMRVKYEKRLDQKERNKSSGLSQLKEILKIDRINRIEAYDISNTSGVQSVGSMVVFENGVQAPKEYRKFKIKTVEGPNDYASLEEVLTRRLNNAKKDIAKGNTHTGFGRLPDLILMDGGKGQVSIANKVLNDLDMNIKVAGLVKDDKHTTRAIIYNNEEIPIKRRDPVYKLIYEIQEEAHRFAINYHRSLMRKTMKKSELDNIKGVGEKTKANLYAHFKTIANMKKASVEELMEVPLVGKQAALEIYKYLKLKG